MNRNGFTLLELMISIAFLVIISGLSFTALQSASNSMKSADIRQTSQSSVRDVMNILGNQLELAATEGNSGLTPVLEAIEVIEEPVATSPVEIAFQLPLDNTGDNWTRRIRFRYINEDSNSNAILDPGEDVDDNGILDRRIVRIEEFGSSEVAEMPVGATNDLSDVQFELINNSMDIPIGIRVFLESSKASSVTSSTPVKVALSKTIYILN